jgi:hypothetical protein
LIYSTDFEQLAGSINYLAVNKYLRDLGWTELPTKRENIKVYQLDNEDGFFQVDLPESREFRDYNQAMHRVIQNISNSLGKSVEQIILELLNPLSDILKFRISGENAEFGSLLIEDGLSLFDYSKKLIAATAKDIVQPRLTHMGRPDTQTADFMKNCRLGQTEIGSYIISVVCPMATIDKNGLRQLTLFDEISLSSQSFTRKVVNKLLSSVQIVKESVIKGGLEELILKNVDRQEDVISTDFLDALIKINSARYDLDISLKYAPTIKENTLSLTNVSFDHDYCEPIRVLIDKIKGVQEKNATYIGRITRLSALPDVDSREGGSITIVYLDANSKKKETKLDLTKDDYQSAIFAHAAGKYVKITEDVNESSLEVLE